MPSEYESTTIKPKTAADIMFRGLSETSLWNNTSIPTATPTAISAPTMTVKPRFIMLGLVTYGLSETVSVGVTCHQRTAVTMVIAKSAMKVYVINLSLVIDEYSFGLDMFSLFS